MSKPILLREKIKQLKHTLEMTEKYLDKHDDEEQDYRLGGGVMEAIDTELIVFRAFLKRNFRISNEDFYFSQEDE